MQHATYGMTWAQWLEDDHNQDATDAEKLAALREYIFLTARKWVNSCSYDAAWANKKLAKMGITDRIPTENRYTIRVPVSGVVELKVYGDLRAEAIEKAKALLDGTRSTQLTGAQATGDFEFTDGPEDPDPAATAADAPQTVDATLDMFREIVLLGHIAGPHICEEDSNRALAEFGLAPIPPRKTFTITRPSVAVLSTKVVAYDEVSAERVAKWRWDSERTGYEISSVDSAGSYQVTAAED